MSPGRGVKNPAASLARRASTVSLGTLISRVLGYVRDMLIAYFFGASMAADAFFVAYKIPNLLRRLLGEGSLSTSFIPVYTQFLTNRGEEEARELLRTVIGAFGILFIILTGLGIIFAEPIVSIIAPGFAGDPEKFGLTVLLTRIMFPFLIAIGLGAIILGVLNSWKLFFIPAIAPAMLNISEIVFMLFVVPRLAVPIIGLAIGVVTGGFAQMLFQLVPVIKKSGGITPIIDLSHPGLKRIGKLMLPAIVGLSIMQVNSFVDTICATLLEAGSVTHLYYGNRLMQLPLALFGTAVATVSLPVMSENAAKKELFQLKKTLSASLKMISFLILPATTGFIVFGTPIVNMLFQRGRFLASDTAATAWVLIFYAGGLIFFSGVKAFVSAFHSLQDTKTPVKIASFAMGVNVMLNIFVVTNKSLKEFFSAGGLALATSLAALINFTLLFLFFRRHHGDIGIKNILSSLRKHITASVLLGFVIFRAGIFTSEWNIYIRTPAVIVFGFFFYMAISLLIKTPEIKEMRTILKRK